MAIRLAVIVALAALVMWEYAPALRGGFVYEDARWTDGCAEHHTSVTRAAVRESWCAQLGQSPVAFHLVSLGLHMLVIGLVGALAWTLTGQALASGFAAAFFGLNAVGVEAVAYLASRGELIAAVGVLGACLAALLRSWLLVGLCVLLGVIGKETAVVAGLLVPLCLWYQSRDRHWAWAAALVGIGIGLAILSETAAWWSVSNLRPALGPWALLQTTAIARVAVLSVLPFGQTVDYDYGRVPVALQVFSVVLLVSGIAWAAVQRNRLLLCGVAWAACACAPRLLVPTPSSVFSEHQFYLPLVGVSLILASLLTQEPCDHYRTAL